METIGLSNALFSKVQQRVLALIFGQPERPAVCNTFRPTEEMCGNGASAALEYLAGLELATNVMLVVSC